MSSGDVGFPTEHRPVVLGERRVGQATAEEPHRLSGQRSFTGFRAEPFFTNPHQHRADGVLLAHILCVTDKPRSGYGAAVISQVPRPLLFLDVDGPLIPFGATPEQLPGGYPIYQAGSELREADTNPLLARINPALGPHLTALPYDLVWATTWMADANECVAPILGLPQLPVLDWPDEPDDEAGALHWKTRQLVTWAAGRPFAWVDDEITDADRAWAAAHRTSPCLLLRIDPRLGLQPDDFTALGAWAAALGPR